jgi:tetratricopeptide (TPR) repeat protein
MGKASPGSGRPTPDFTLNSSRISPHHVIRYLISLIFCACFCTTVFPQTKQDAEQWLPALNDPKNDTQIVIEPMWTEWSQKDSTYLNRAMQLIEEEVGSDPSKIMEVKLMLLKGYVACVGDRNYEGTDCIGWCKRALQGATALDNKHLQQGAFSIMALYYHRSRNYDPGLFYSLKSIELAEELQFSRPGVNGMKVAASSVLYNTHNYEVAIKFCRDILSVPEGVATSSLIAVHNNTGLCYRAMGRYDSAIYHFNRAAETAQQNNLGVWVGIARGNVGDVLNLQHRPDEAMPLWQQDVDSCIKHFEWENAGVSMALISEYYLNRGELPKAKSLLKRAQEIAGFRPTDRLLMLRIRSAFYRKEGLYDSAIHFLDKYYGLQDSLNAVIARTNYEQLKLRLDYDNNTSQVKLIRHEKEAEITRRNFLLVALAIALFAGWLLLNRQRLRYKLAVQQQRFAESEAQSARDQLELFTQTLLEKNKQIEELSGQLHDIQQRSDDELIRQSILTDEDWTRFRQLFERAHAGFFDRLKKSAPGITTAETRLAALIRLNLDTRQMASMQGISVSSVRGNKTRLRQRLNIGENGLEEFVGNL